MSNHHHEDPAADGAARAAQIAAMTLSITEGLVRLRSERLAAKTADDERAAGALRARHRADQAAAWLHARAATSTPAAGTASAANPVSVAIICTPRDVAGQAFPVPMPQAMATAPQAAREAVRVAGALPAVRAQRQLSGPSRGPGVPR
ncbi:MAG TPA: hypothetical protein VI248_25600 [Kineosporiaceae bacterium]